MTCTHPHDPRSARCQTCAAAHMRTTRTKTRPPCDRCGAALHRSTKGATCAACLKTAVVATPDSWKEHGNTADVTRTVHERIKTLAQLIAVCEIDTEVWEIKRWTCNKWENAAYDKEQRRHVIAEVWQVKATLTRRTAYLAAKDEIAALVADAKTQIPARRVPKLNLRTADHMLEVNIPDLHLGKLAWSVETGHQDYDLKIAEALYEQALDTLLARVASFRFHSIVLPIGSDFLNSDNKAGTTTRGTPQDVDSRYQKSFLVGRRLMVRVIERLRAMAPVHAIVVPGNHDELAAWHLGDSLECFFHRTDGVTIDNAPTLRKYHRFHNTLLLFTHGDKVKPANYPLLMATERANDFGATAFREAHVGHIHQTKLQEWNGVRVRTLSALCSADAWHAGAGYVGNLRSAEAFVWARQEGLVTIATFTHHSTTDNT